MKYLCNDSNRVFMAILKDQLEQAGIQWHVKNQYSSNSMLAGNISCYSAELYLVHAEDYDKAQALMKELADEHDDLSRSFTWVCPECSETLEPQFNECCNLGVTYGDSLNKILFSIH